MAHNELLSVLLVFGTQLPSKNVKESHMVPKNILGVNWVSFWLYGWYVKPYISHKHSTDIYRFLLYVFIIGFYSCWRSRYHSVFGYTINE